MMSEEKQIEEMAKAICEHYVKGGCGRCPDCFCDGDALKLYNAGYRKQSVGEWISAEERLPDNGETVLTVDNEGYMIVASWYELGGWFLPVCRANPVTHWMPLPEPPKTNQ